MPIISAPVGLTKPEAGVIATRPATAPDTRPRMLGFLAIHHSQTIQARAAAAVAICVAAMAIPALTLAVTAEPALNPNQPTHSNEAPITLYTRLYGAMFSLPSPWRAPSTRAQTRPAVPAFRCTTVPPA